MTSRTVVIAAAGALVVFALCGVAGWFARDLRTAEAAPVKVADAPPQQEPPVTRPNEDQILADRFHKALETSNDPVGLAMPIANLALSSPGQVPDAGQGRAPLEAMKVLAEHWQDPRAEATLAEIARKEPRVAREGFPTLAGKGQEFLQQVLAKKEYFSILDGAKTPQEKVARIRAAFEAHPNWLEPGKVPDQAYLIKMLVDTALALDPPAAIDLGVRSGVLSGDDVRQHAGALLRYARQLDPDKALADPQLLMRLEQTQDPGAAPLVESWLAALKDDKSADRLVAALAKLPGAEKRLQALLNDARPAVALEAVSWLHSRFPDPSSLQAVEQLLQKREQQGAPEKERKYLRAVIDGMKKTIAENQGGTTP
jgi:hypothetical protein